MYEYNDINEIEDNEFNGIKLFFILLLFFIITFVLGFIVLVSKVEAQTIETNKFRIWAYGSDSVDDGRSYLNDVSGMAYSPSYGWQIYPYNNGLLPLGRGQYSITINYIVDYNALWVASGWRDGWFGWNTYLQVVKNDIYTNATCDGIESNTATRYVQSAPDNLGRSTWTAWFTYSCDLFNVTDNFDFFSFKIYNNSNFAKSIGGSKAFSVESFQFLDKEDINDNSQAIINNQNNNTNRIMDNNNSNTDRITEAQQDTTEAIEDLNDLINNNNVSSNTGNDFFNNFSNNNHGLSGILTAPLVAINSLLQGDSCTPMTATYKGKTFSFPCGSTLWGKSNVAPLKNFLNLTFGGLLCYAILRKLFLKINELKDPTNDRIEVMDL